MTIFNFLARILTKYFCSFELFFWKIISGRLFGGGSEALLQRGKMRFETCAGEVSFPIPIVQIGNILRIVRSWRSNFRYSYRQLTYNMHNTLFVICFVIYVYKKGLVNIYIYLFAMLAKWLDQIDCIFLGTHGYSAPRVDK